MEFAKSLSGHDKNQYYFILNEENDFYMLVNGTTRPLNKPKRKNKKHVQIVKRLPVQIEKILHKEVTDLTIKKAILEYNKLVNKKQEEW